MLRQRKIKQLVDNQFAVDKVEFGRVEFLALAFWLEPKSSNVLILSFL